MNLETVDSLVEWRPFRELVPVEESPEFHGFEQAAGSSKSKSIDDVA